MNDIFVIDDESSVLSMVRESLSSIGLLVRTASSGQEAIQVFTEHHDSIGVALLDVHLGDMDGAAIFNELKKIDPSVQVIFMSGENSVPEELERLGPIHFVRKPFSSVQDLAQVLEPYLGTR